MSVNQNPIEFRLEATGQSSQPYKWSVVRRSTAKKLAYSENYTSRQGAINAVAAVQAGRCTYEVFQGTDKQWYFRIKSTNGVDILARSAYKYASKASCEADKELIRLNAATAGFLDYSKAA